MIEFVIVFASTVAGVCWATDSDCNSAPSYSILPDKNSQVIMRSIATPSLSLIFESF